MNSILTDVKKAIGGIPEEIEAFDQDLILFINSELSTLNQLGFGPDEGYEIDCKTQSWEDLFTDPRLNFVKEFIVLKVKMVFDPPQSSFVMDALKTKSKELEWRINVMAEQLKEAT